MSLKSKPSLVLLFVLATVFFFGAFPYCCSSSIEEGPKAQFVFIVRLGQIDWETRTLEAPIDIWFENLPDNFKNEKGEYNFSSIPVDFEQWHNSGQVLLLPEGKDSQIIYHGSLPTNRFNFRGLTELYPFDSYLLDITFRSPSFGLINENNTVTKPENFAGGFDLREEPGTGNKPFTMTYETQEWGEEVVLNFKVYVSRSSSSTNLIMQVLGICYLLVGSLPLIRPEKLEHRLSVCLSLFIFAVTFTFTIPIPTLNRATLAENLIFILLTGAGAFSVVSVVEKALLEAKQKFAVSRFLIEGLVVLFLVGTLWNALTGLISPQLAAEYAWASFPQELMYLLSVSLLFGYVSVTLVFALNILWKNREKIRKRSMAVRLSRK
jgi:hypothetical protein